MPVALQPLLLLVLVLALLSPAVSVLAQVKRANQVMGSRYELPSPLHCALQATVNGVQTSAAVSNRHLLQLRRKAGEQSAALPQAVNCAAAGLQLPTQVTAQ